MKTWLKDQFRNSPSLYRIWLLFTGLTEREQKLTLLLLVFVFSLFLYLGILRPAQQSYETARSAHEKILQDYYLIAKNAAVLRENPTTGKTGWVDRSANDLRAIINQTARTHGVIAERITLDGDSRIQIWVKEAPFTIISEWLASLGRQQVNIYALQMNSRAPGLVDLRMTLD